MYQLLGVSDQKWHMSLPLMALGPEEVTWPHLIRKELENVGHR